MHQPLQYSWRLHAILALFLLGFSVVFGRLGYLHLVGATEQQETVQALRQKTEIRHPRRGNIFDQQGNLLAGTQPLMQVGVDPAFTTPEDAQKLPELGRLVGIPAYQLEKIFSRKFRKVENSDTEKIVPIRWCKLNDGVTDEVFQQILQLDIAGVYGNRWYKRVYPGNQLASHIIGYLNKEQVACMGVERYMDYYLSGEAGWIETEKDGLSKELPWLRTRDIPSSDGYDVTLSIDLGVQNIIEREIARLAKSLEPEGVSIIVSKPQTGKILGLANYPSFDANCFWEYDIAAFRNRAVTDQYEPGSTFKIVPAAAALNESLVLPHTEIDCSVAVAEYRNRRIPLPRDHHQLGMLTVSEVVSKSSNRGAAQLGMMLGEDRLYDYAHAFGFGASTGSCIDGEIFGTLHRVRDWDGWMISRIPMGHSVAATPLQVHYAMSVVANDGVLMVPQVVERISASEGKLIHSMQPRIRRRVISSDAAYELAGMLINTATREGTAGKAYIPGYQVAGKTGTTQKIVDGRYSHQQHVSSFTGFFPASAPKLVITVVVDEPKLDGVGYGGSVAAPAFKNIAQQLIQYFAIPPVEWNDDNQLPVVAWKGVH